MISLDTHALVWSLLRPTLLSSTARAALEAASSWGVSSAVLYEMRYKNRMGKWPEIDALVDGLHGRLDDLGFEIFAADASTMDLAGGFDWSHRDPFDRIIAATCVTFSALQPRLGRASAARSALRASLSLAPTA